MQVTCRLTVTDVSGRGCVVCECDVTRAKALGLLGLGRVGSAVSTIARALGMNVVAWSQNLTSEHALACGAQLVNKEALVSTADFLSIQRAS